MPELSCYVCALCRYAKVPRDAISCESRSTNNVICVPTPSYEHYRLDIGLLSKCLHLTLGTISHCKVSISWRCSDIGRNVCRVWCRSELCVVMHAQITSNTGYMWVVAALPFVLECEDGRCLAFPACWTIQIFSGK